jgi:hypothetical protein
MAAFLFLLVFSSRPALTTVSDTVFRANGFRAAGTLLISWPPFTTADNHTVAAGNLSVTLGAGDSFLAQLAPNAGATPASTVYTVAYQLDDSTVKTGKLVGGHNFPRNDLSSEDLHWDVRSAGASRHATICECGAGQCRAPEWDRNDYRS